jgi:secreted trypsin-like serine protease
VRRPKSLAMRPLLRAVLATTVAALAFAAPSGAVLNGQPDTSHRYVGILVTEINGEIDPVCSGFLVSPTVFVTAAHCIADLGSDPAYVSFDQAFTPTSPLMHGTAVPNPAFGGPERNTHDIALVVLDEPVTDRAYAELPRLGLLDGRKKSSLTVVGYGATDFSKHRTPVFELQRTSGEATLSKLQKGGFNLRMSSGICFGDSGAPVLLRDSDVAVGINSYVNNGNCTGNAYAFRLDTAEALDFLAPYLS